MKLIPKTKSNFKRLILETKALKFQRNFSSATCEAFSQVPRERMEGVVIGAGIVGIAVARELSLHRNRQILAVDSGPSFGTGTSARNSEVIHAGIYYPPKSLKALFCVRGRELMYKYCEEHGIPHKQVGKLIVATRSSGVPKLNNIMNLGIENGVEGLKMIEGYEAMRLEPELQCVKALLSPVSGIVDSHSLMLSMVGYQSIVGLGGS